MTPERHKEIQDYVINYLNKEVSEVIKTRDGYVTGLYHQMLIMARMCDFITEKEYDHIHNFLAGHGIGCRWKRINDDDT